MNRRSKENFQEVVFIVHWSGSSHYKLQADGVTEQGRILVLQSNKHPYPVNSKNATKNNIIFNFVLCQVRLIFFNTNLSTTNNISLVKPFLKTLQITANLVKSRYKRKKTSWLGLVVFFRGGTLSRIPLRPVLIST